MLHKDKANRTVGHEAGCVYIKVEAEKKFRPGSDRYTGNFNVVDLVKAAIAIQEK